MLAAGLTPLQRARISTATVFFVFGALLATWVSRIPVIQNKLHLSNGELGIALLGAPVGQLLAMGVTPRLVHRWSSATTTRRAILATGGCTVLLGLAGSLTALTVFLVLLGFTLGTLDICMNTQAVAVERRYGRPVMSGLHGVYSVGVLVGAAFGAGAAALGVVPVAHFAVATCLLGLVAVFGARDLLGRSADVAVDATTGSSIAHRRPRLREHPTLIAIGVVAFCSLFAEGAADNWSGVFLHQVEHASYGLAPLGTAMVGVGMAIGRFAGDGVIARWGRAKTLLWASLVASAGIVLAVVGGSIPAALAGYAVFGLGVATIVPISFTVAGNTSGVAPAWALSRVSTMAYVGQLSSPAIIGLVAHTTGLSWALAIPAMLLVLVAPLSRVARGR